MSYVIGLDMCKICTEAVDCVSHFEHELCKLQVWTCVKFTPRQSIA